LSGLLRSAGSVCLAGQLSVEFGCLLAVGGAADGGEHVSATSKAGSGHPAARGVTRPAWRGEDHELRPVASRLDHRPVDVGLGDGGLSSWPRRSRRRTGRARLGLYFSSTANPGRVGPRFQAINSRSSSSSVRCSTCSSRSTSAHHASRDPPLTVAGGADRSSGNRRRRHFRESWPRLPTADRRRCGPGIRVVPVPGVKTELPRAEEASPLRARPPRRRVLPQPRRRWQRYRHVRRCVLRRRATPAGRPATGSGAIAAARTTAARWPRSG
jgi:hypothetical protein